MQMTSRQQWANRLDKYCAVTGSLVPVGLVIGNIGFESVVGLVGLGWLIRCILIKEFPLRQLLKNPLTIPWLVWFASIILSLIVNGPGSKGWAHDVVFIRYVLFGTALLDISGRQPVAKYFVYGLAAGVLWAALNTVSAYIFGSDLLGKPLIRYTGKLKEASRISGLSAYAAAFFLSWSLLDNKLTTRARTGLIVFGLVAFSQVLQTNVRTAILGACAGIFIAAAYFVKKKKLIGIAVAVMLAVTISVGVVFYKGEMFDLSSVYDRVYFWKVAWGMWRDHPVFGVGISSFQDVYKEMAASGTVPEYVAPDGRVFNEAEQTHAHSLFFMLMACTGLLGLAAFVWLFITATRMSFNNIVGFRCGLLPWPVVLAVIGITGFNIYHSWYQALLAFLLVLIGAAAGGDAENTSDL